jgi:hypothetical protein
MVTRLKDGGEIYIYSFGNASSPERLTHVATLHLPLPHDRCVLLELTRTTGPLLAGPPAHVFTLHYKPAAHCGRWEPTCLVVLNRTLIQYVDAYREEAGATDVPWEEWGPQEARVFVLAIGF